MRGRGPLVKGFAAAGVKDLGGGAGGILRDEDGQHAVVMAGDQRGVGHAAVYGTPAAGADAGNRRGGLLVAERGAVAARAQRGECASGGVLVRKDGGDGDRHGEDSFSLVFGFIQYARRRADYAEGLWT